MCCQLIQHIINIQQLICTVPLFNSLLLHQFKNTLAFIFGFHGYDFIRVYHTGKGTRNGFLDLGNNDKEIALGVGGILLKVQE